MESRIVIGTDEVGRGCLAGPVVAAAVILPPEYQPWMDDIRDSKKIAPKKRIVLANKISSTCVWSISEVPPYRIDEMNILRASLYAMREAVRNVYFKVKSPLLPGLVLVDGEYTIPDLELPVAQEALIGGDNLHKAIGASSILAKVYRDNYMIGIDAIYPEYGFSRNVGYGTKEHVDALYLNGPCVVHRKSFSPTKDLI
jgi:ribonuclease HII